MVDIIVAIIGGTVALIGYCIINSSDKKLMQYKLDAIQKDITDINSKFKVMYLSEKEIEKIKIQIKMLESEVLKIGNN